MKQIKKNNALVPKLRFPEFRKKGKWEEKVLDELGQTFGGLNGKSSEDFGFGKPYITYRQIFNYSRIDLTKCQFVMVSDNETQNIVQYGDVLFTMSSETSDEIGYASVLLDFPKNSVYLNSFCFIFRPFKLDVLNPEFSRYLFHSPIYRRAIARLAQGITRFNISKSLFLSLRLSIPKKPNEQQKIASCLSSLDDLITAQDKKIEALKKYKKGLMQQLFPAEEETTPKLRFPEFRGKGEWKYLNGDKMFEQISNKNHNSDLPILAITQEHGAIPRDKIDYTVIVTDKSVKSYKIVEVGDFIISLRSFQGGIEYSYYVGLCSPAYIILRKKNKFLIDIFFKYYFKTEMFIRLLNRNIEGIRDGKMVSYKQFSEILIPSTKPDEQQKIASCLSSLDDLITAHSHKLETLKRHKKGLMQGLFPINNNINR